MSDKGKDSLGNISKGASKPSKSRLRQNKAKKRDSLSSLEMKSSISEGSYLKGKKF